MEVIEPTQGFAGAQWLSSPNCRPRTAEEPVLAVIIHATWMDDDAAVLKRLTDPEAQVSAHYYITRQGHVIQLVDEAHVAWHAGKSTLPGLPEGNGSLNGVSIGIELANRGPFATPPTPQEECPPADSLLWQKAEPYTQAQYGALIGLLQDIAKRHPGITPAHIVGHSQVSPGRKADPGPHFGWQKLADAGVSVLPAL